MPISNYCQMKKGKVVWVCVDSIERDGLRQCFPGFSQPGAHNRGYCVILQTDPLCAGADLPETIAP